MPRPNCEQTKSLVAIVGPTGVGKSRLAIDIALALNGEIINADSRQVYRYMDIGTNKPSREDRLVVSHHLYDIVDPDEEFNLAIYKEMAVETIKHVQRQGKLPLLVGGSGMYVWAVVENWQIPTVPPDVEFRKTMEALARQKGSQSLYQELCRVDPLSATKIAPTNVRRIIRALEIFRATGQPASALKQKGRPLFKTKLIGLNMERSLLYNVINERVDRMLKLGLVDEVRMLLEKGYTLDLPSMSSVGYKQIALYLMGQTTLMQAVERIKVETHRFARNQYTWFRPCDPRITWFWSNENSREPIETVRHFIEGDDNSNDLKNQVP